MQPDFNKSTYIVNDVSASVGDAEMVRKPLKALFFKRLIVVSFVVRR